MMKLREGDFEVKWFTPDRVVIALEGDFYVNLIRRVRLYLNDDNGPRTSGLMVALKTAHRDPHDHWRIQTLSGERARELGDVLRRLARDQYLDYGRFIGSLETPPVVELLARLGL